MGKLEGGTMKPISEMTDEEIEEFFSKDVDLELELDFKEDEKKADEHLLTDIIIRNYSTPSRPSSKTSQKLPPKLQNSYDGTYIAPSSSSSDLTTQVYSDEEDLRIQMELEKESKEDDEYFKKIETELEEAIQRKSEELVLELVLQELQFQGQYVEETESLDDDFDDFE